MAASLGPGPRRKTMSRCSPEMDRCVHVFEIDRYSLHEGSRESRYIQSATFAVGGHDWCVGYFPCGYPMEEFKDYVSVFLKLLSTTATEVRAIFSLCLLHPDTGGPSYGFGPKNTFFSTARSTLGCKKFMKRSGLEAYLRGDRLVIECSVTVITDTSVLESVPMFDIEVPPSDLPDNLGRLLKTQKGTDVTFRVKEENFHAHKIVLAMRSHVFEAQFYGPLGENEKPYIRIEDMEPSVFKTLLQFIYTDSLPAMDDLDGDEREEMVKHLLVAADRYAMERMKLVCESILSKRLNARSVSTTLALADQYHCIKLKNACIGFINSMSSMDDVMKSQGYEHLKRACPAVFVEIWEKAAKSRKIQ